MTRNTRCDALVLAVHCQGENNRSVCALSPEDGVFYATLYGGPKSKLKALVSPWHCGTIWLYRDEVKKTIKITDFDVKNYHLSFRENLYKAWAAALCGELIIKTKCAGSTVQCWTLVNGFLDGMEYSTEQQSRIGTIRFIWRYLTLMGILPDVHTCARCGIHFSAGNFEKNAVLLQAAYDPAENNFVCNQCADMRGRHFILREKALWYLAAISDLDSKTVRSIPVDKETFCELKQLSFFLLENACGSPLKSLNTGIGIL
jgi:DNA repair protein RecO (recombination protein O)